MTYGAFLVALFAIAAGCSILETSASPYVISLGPTRGHRHPPTQPRPGLQPLGTNIGVLIASTPTSSQTRRARQPGPATSEQLREIRAEQLRAVMGPYIGLGVLLVLIGLAIALQKSPTPPRRATPAAADD